MAGPPRRPQGGPWRPATAFQSTPRAGKAPAPNLPSFVSNAYAPQIDVGLAAGIAVLFAVGSLASSNTAQGAEYQFGTHAAAVYESQFKGTIWGPARAAAATPKTLGAFIQAPPQADPTQIAPSVIAPLRGQTPPQIGPVSAAPQSIDLTIQGFVQAPLVSPQGRLLGQFSIAPQSDPSQPAGLIVAAALASVIIPPAPARLALAAPQTVDLTLTASIFGPQSAPQGRAPPTIVASPQADPSQVAAQIQPSLRTPPIVPNPLAGFVSTLPQFEERVTQVVYPSQSAGFTARVPPLFQGGPQFVDLTIQGWIESPQIAPQGPVPRLSIGAPQFIDLTLQGAIIAPFRGPPSVITGPTVAMLPAIAPQAQIDVSYSVLWTPSTFSSSAPPVVVIDPFAKSNWQRARLSPKEQAKHKKREVALKRLRGEFVAEVARTAQQPQLSPAPKLKKLKRDAQALIAASSADEDEDVLILALDMEDRIQTFMQLLKLAKDI